MKTSRLTAKRTGERTRDLDHAIESHHLVRALREYGLTQADIGLAVGVTDRTVRNWEQGQPLRRTHEARLQDLRRVVLALGDSLTRRGVGQWFRAHNRVLGGRRPLDVFAEGDVEEVIAAAEAFADGAYV